MDNKILYRCDPSKNKECSKQEGCKHNPNAIYKDCEHTSKKEYSIDGIPLTTITPIVVDNNKSKYVGMARMDRTTRLNIYVPDIILEAKDIETLKEYLHRTIDEVIEDKRKEWKQ